MKKLLSKKWFGRYSAIAVIGVIMAVLALGACIGVAADWHWNQSLTSSSIEIKGSSLQAFTTSSLNTQFSYPTDTLGSFIIDRDIFQGSTPPPTFQSNIHSVWLHNNGNTNLFPVLSTTWSASGLSLSSSSGIVTSTPIQVLSTIIPVGSATIVDPGWQGHGSPTVPSQYNCPISAAISGIIPASGYAIIGQGTSTQEIIRYTAISGNLLTGIYDLSTSTLHVAGDTITFSNTYNPTPFLAPGQTTQVDFYLNADSTASETQTNPVTIVIDCSPGS